MDVIQYVTEEVSRQGHNVFMLDGIERVGWMLNAWSYALSSPNDKPTLEDAIRLGMRVEASKNAKGIRKCGVRVGSRICPKPEDVRVLLERLFEYGQGLTPIEFYKEFELIHPFVDGNGRTGKVLLNWRNGTLSDPIFPPNDLFGDWITNP